LISYGKVGIFPEGGIFPGTYLNAKVDISLKQTSLVVSGIVRMIAETVRVIDEI